MSISWQRPISGLPFFTRFGSTPALKLKQLRQVKQMIYVLNKSSHSADVRNRSSDEKILFVFLTETRLFLRKKKKLTKTKSTRNLNLSSLKTDRSLCYVCFNKSS